MFSKFDKVFCDSLEAINWAYDCGLPKSAVIYTSSPALLYSNLNNVKHVEAIWSRSNIKKFNKGMLRFSEEVFSVMSGIDNVTRGEALLAAIESLRFNIFLYKASCLKEEDFSEKLLFIKVDSRLGKSKKDLNSPWDYLLKNNGNLKVCTYTIKNSKFEKMSTKGVSLYNRIKIAGLESLIYKGSIIISNILPKFLKRKNVLVNKENELGMETIAGLVMKGYAVREINSKNTEDVDFKNFKYKKILKELIEKRVKEWVCPQAEKLCVDYLLNSINCKLKDIYSYNKYWVDVLQPFDKNTIVFSGSLGNASGLALYDVCHDRRIPIVTTLHGVTHEISELVKSRSSRFDSSISDLCLTHTDISSKVHNSTLFSHAQTMAVGLPSRVLRMKLFDKSSSNKRQLLYISTCLYKGNFSGHFVDFENDYYSFKRELGLVSNVFSKITCTMSYKGYPEENLRYPDRDPLVDYVKSVDKIRYIESKVDVRYLLSEYNVLISSGATSTIGWLVMTGKPVIFINWSSHMPLTKDAKKYFEKGLFLFDGDSKDFYKDLKYFLETPYSKIRKMWNNKLSSRNIMIERYFTKYTSNPRKRSANAVHNYVKQYISKENL